MLNDLELIKLALAEDIGTGDITTEAISSVVSAREASASLVARESGVLSGSQLVHFVYSALPGVVEVRFRSADGARFDSGATIADLRGDPKTILTGERLALNLLSRMCGVATRTRQLADLISDTETEILDTRKTTPLWRKWEKRAVLHGGGVNHRMGLYDHVLVKDNHIRAAGGLRKALEAARDGSSPVYKLEVEIESLADLETAIELGADWVMLDNMSPADVKKGVEIARGRVVLEASGGINASNIREYAETGVDYVSSSEITQSARPLNLALDFH
ncbi:MAG: carboxylating nicotinate-nucleotide diphosphorylase [bacterium]|jgi:nicotinate-nucleotide pyrophosphorylase (carboxylating)